MSVHFDLSYIQLLKLTIYKITQSIFFHNQAAADDEISFDPNDVITNIEMVKIFRFILVRSISITIQSKVISVFKNN